MNIFFLSFNIQKCAMYHCNSHVVKMILELCQMLYTCHALLNSKNLPSDAYKKTHENHPTCKWVRESRSNYIFTVKLAVALCKEYTLRFRRVHSCLKHVRWLRKNIPTFECRCLTNPPLAMPDEYKSNDVILSYRKYYLSKKKLLVWYVRDVPKFAKEYGIKKPQPKYILQRTF